MNRLLHLAVLGELNATENTISATPWRSFGKREWECALGWLDLSGLAIYFRHKIESSNGWAAFPDSVQSALKNRHTGNQLRTTAIFSEFRALIESFEKKSVNYAVLKGIALLPDYCPDPALRTQYDHDILVDEASLDGAEQALLNLGYRRKVGKEGESTVVYRRPEPQIRFSQSWEGLYSPELGRSVELHLTLWEEAEERIHLNLSNDFLERCVPREWEGLRFRALCDEDCLLFQILHAFRHVLRNWCRLSIFLEIGAFMKLRSSDSEFWKSFGDRIEALRWAPEASFVVLTLAQELFGATIPLQLQASLNTRRAPALKLWIERYGKHAALSNFRGDKCSLFLHEEFVDSPADWAAVRRRRLFPVQRPHRPPAVVFQRSFSVAGRLWMENVHALTRLKFHGLAGLRYALEYPRWSLLRRLRLADCGDA